MKLRIDTTNAATNTTHLLWVGRWIEVTKAEVLGEPAWTFKSGRDAAEWLLWPLLWKTA